MNVFHYKDFIGSIEADPESKCFHGKLLYINDLVTYEAENIPNLEIEFKKAIKDYLLTKTKINIVSRTGNSLYDKI